MKEKPSLIIYKELEFIVGEINKQKNNCLEIIDSPINVYKTQTCCVTRTCTEGSGMVISSKRSSIVTKSSNKDQINRMKEKVKMFFEKKIEEIEKLIDNNIFILLKSYLSDSGLTYKFSWRIIGTLEGKFLFYGGDRDITEKRFDEFRTLGILEEMVEVCGSFDLSEFPEDIYKRYVFLSF